MPSAIKNDEWDLPRVKASIGLEANEQDEIFDVKFFPYGAPDDDPVFAAVGTKIILVYRLRLKANPPQELIQIFKDDDPDAGNCCCTWSKEPETEIPWLCVAGVDRTIKIFDVVNATLVQALAGHGSEVNDLVTSPLDPNLILSASQDTTVRLWSLKAADKKQPCLCIFGGEGHLSGLLTVAFHKNGRYVLSGGHDNCVSLWTVPDLPARPETNPPPPLEVLFPHFFTDEVHSGIVDCVAFFDDLILSRACHEDIIVLWRIEGFSSRDPIPSTESAPMIYDQLSLTRSYFRPPDVLKPAAPLYTRMVQFCTPGSAHQFYMRFRLFHEKDHHPILAFGNANSSIFFWDLARVVEYQSFMAKLNDEQRESPIQRPSWLALHHPRGRGDTLSRIRDAEDKDSVWSGRTSSDGPEGSSDVNGYSEETLYEWQGKYDMEQVEVPLYAHYEAHVSVKGFIGRQVAWSPGGKWCIVVGSRNLAMVLGRWL